MQFPIHVLFKITWVKLLDYNTCKLTSNLFWLVTLIMNVVYTSNLWISKILTFYNMVLPYALHSINAKSLSSSPYPHSIPRTQNSPVILLGLQERIEQHTFSLRLLKTRRCECDWWSTCWISRLLHAPRPISGTMSMLILSHVTQNDKNFTFKWAKVLNFL